MASKAAPSETKSQQPLHDFPVDLRLTAADQVAADPAPDVAEDNVVPGQGNSHKAVKTVCDSSNGKLRKSTRKVAAAAAAAGSGGLSERQRKLAEDKRKVEEDKRKVEEGKIRISLTKEEIEEDVYSMTGARPRPRPRKRPRTVQKLLDNVFPALSLVGMNAESYRARAKELMDHK